jgi:alkanesulfonate monooxygenase SsuD/methylene tetrahydromethanopterin reductase-like flavin-dependent oxidoreductase (luciferase family)
VRIGVFIGEASGERTSVEALVANARDAQERGFATGWVPHIPWSLDAMTAATVAATATSTLEVATAVLPTFPRHPLALGQEALSVQAVAQGRFTLGIGPSHPVVIENMYGLSYEQPAARTAEYVQVLQACFARTGRVQHAGEHYRVDALLDVPDARPVPLLVAVRDRLQGFADAGATDLCASVLGLDADREASRLATLDVLAGW